MVLMKNIASNTEAAGQINTHLIRTKPASIKHVNEQKNTANNHGKTQIEISPHLNLRPSQESPSRQAPATCSSTAELGGKKRAERNAKTWVAGVRSRNAEKRG